MITVLIVDDSAFMRQTLTRLLSEDPEIQVVGVARDGEEAVRLVKTLDPDVVTLDVEMPGMDGLTALSIIMRQHPVPVLMISSLTQRGASATIRALSLGAVDFIPKPGGPVSVGMSSISTEIRDKVKNCARARVRRREPPAEAASTQTKKVYMGRPAGKVVVIAASTGGPAALETVLSALPGDLRASVLVVQHMPPGFTASLARRLNNMSALRIAEASDGAALTDGTGWVAPGGRHMSVTARTVHVHDGPALHGVRPAADLTMISAADAFGSDTIGVVLTGMGKDGTTGTRWIKSKGGRTIAQDEETSVIYGMPKNAAEAGYIDRILPLHRIAGEIVSMLG